MKKLFFKLMLRPTKILYRLSGRFYAWIGSILIYCAHRGLLTPENPLRHVWRLAGKFYRKSGRLLVHVRNRYYFRYLGR